MDIGDSPFDEWARDFYPALPGLARRYCRCADVDDVVQSVSAGILRSWAGWAAAPNKDAYLRTTVRNNAGTWHKATVARGQRECSPIDPDALPTLPADDPSRRACVACELDVVRELLEIAPRRQRDVLMALYDCDRRRGQIAAVAAGLGLRPDTIRRQRQCAREKLGPFLTGEGHDLRRWRRAGENAHEDFRLGRVGTVVPRPVIHDAWTSLRSRGVDPDRGTQVVLLDRDELRRRREQCGISGSLVAREFDDFAARNELLAVVLDDECVVLHRGGDRATLAAADVLGFVDGACWSLEKAGVTAAGLARRMCVPMTVNGWEHYFSDQHGLSCVSIPVHGPFGVYTVNLTTAAGAISVPRATHQGLHGIALRLGRQLWSRTAAPGGRGVRIR